MRFRLFIEEGGGGLFKYIMLSKDQIVYGNFDCVLIVTIKYDCFLTKHSCSFITSSDHSLLCH